MGLDTTHECWHGAYSAFNRWRDKMAEAAGYKFKEYDEFPFRLVDIDWDTLAPVETSPTLNGEWEKTPDDPLLVLLVHYDCEGYIFPEQAGPLADRLEEILPKLGEEDGGGHIGLYSAKTEQFIKGLRKAVKKNQKVGFH